MLAVNKKKGSSPVVVTVMEELRCAEVALHHLVVMGHNIGHNLIFSFVSFVVPSHPLILLMKRFYCLPPGGQEIQW